MSSVTSTGVQNATNTSAAQISQMQDMADNNNAMTMASMQINMQQQETSALATVANNGAKNISDAAKGQ